MKYSRGQFNSENYKLWQKGFVLAQPSQGSVYKVLYTKSSISSCSSITLKAFSILDALERACYETTYSSTFRPEEIDLLAVFDADENLVWIDEPYYIVLQKKHEFRGIERREFLRIFGGFSVLSLFALKSPFAWGASTTVNFAGTSVGFTTESIFSTPGTFNWTVPIGVTSISFVCVGAGGKNAQAGGGVGTDNVGGGAAGGGGNSGGGGGALGYKNGFSVTPGASITVKVGDATSRNSTVAGLTSASFTFIGSGGAGGSGSGVSSTGGGGGGGAGGYAGNGGSGGAGGAGGSSVGGGIGGGVGLLGQGTSGAGGNASAGECGSGGNGTNGNAGSGGAGGGGAGGGGNGGGPGVGKNGSHTIQVDGCSNPYYGAGAGGDGNSIYGGARPAGTGAVRIIWGVGKSFPTNAS